MKPRFTLCLLSILVFSLPVFSQSAINYQLTVADTASLLTNRNGDSIKMSNRPNLVPTSNFLNNTPLYPIGFDFVFMGKYYSHFIASSLGRVALGLENSPAGMIQVGSNYSNGGLTRPVQYPPTANNNAPLLAPFWSFTTSSATGATIRAQTIGVSPNRCLVVQWNVLISGNSPTISDPADGMYQVRLYERSGLIEYVYGKMTIGSIDETVDASIGFTSGNTLNSFKAIKNLVDFATTHIPAEEPATRTLVNSEAQGPIAGLHAAVENNRKVLAFTPPQPSGNFTSSASLAYAQAIQLQWTDNISNKTGYLLYRSINDSSDYQFLGSLPASQLSTLQENLLVNTRYYWKLIAHTEGNMSSQIVFTDSTRCNSGIYTIGPGGDYSSIQFALNDIRIKGLSDNTILEILPGHNFSSETFPIRPGFTFQCNPDATITLRPASSSSFHVVTSSNTPIFLLDSTHNFILDGRAGGTGNSAFTIEGPGELVKIVDGIKNQLKFIHFKSDVSNPILAPLNIEGFQAYGSQYNLVDHCRFSDRGAGYTLPLQMVYSNSNEDYRSKNTSIVNCEFLNFRKFAINAEGRAWQILNNSFYSTVPVQTTDSSGWIQMRKPDVYYMPVVITGNYFGGSGSQCSGDVMNWTTGRNFKGIAVHDNYLITNNVFKRIAIRSQYLPNADLTNTDIIYTGLGGSSIYPLLTAEITSNYFGGEQAADSIALISNNQYDSRASIISNTRYCPKLKHNKIVNIRSTAINHPSFRMNLIQSTAFVAIDSNYIGSNDPAYPIKHMSDGYYSVINTTVNATITNNKLINIIAKKRMAGIECNYNNHQLIAKNDIRQLTSLEAHTDIQFYSVAGIVTRQSNYLQITGNRITHLQDGSTNDNLTNVIGILSLDNLVTIEGNFIDCLFQNPIAGFDKGLIAIRVDEGNNTIVNNMVRLGVDAHGNSLMRGSFTGITTNTQVGASNVLHNTIYIAGISGSEEAFSGCIFYLHAFTIRNNILVNNRTHPTENQSHQVYRSSSASTNPSVDYNVCHQANNSYFTYVNYYLNFPQWQATGKDLNSVFADPLFVSAGGDTAHVDLHIKDFSPAERKGTTNSTSTADFDGQIRTILSPVDVGADAGNYRSTNDVRTLCPGGNTSFSVVDAGVGANYSWEVDKGNGFIAVATDTVHGVANTNILLLTSVPSSYRNFNYRCKVTVGANTTYSPIFSCRFKNEWRGTNSQLWSDAGNWSCGSLPDANTEVLIASGTVLIDVNAIIYSLTQAPGTTVTVNPGIILQIIH